MAETKIEPALSADQWGILKRIHWLSVDDNDVQIDGRELVVIARDYSTAVFRDGIPALIALANAALIDSDDRKITRERVQALRAGAAYIWRAKRGEGDFYAPDGGPYGSETASTLEQMADALESYLPPEG